MAAQQLIHRSFQEQRTAVAAAQLGAVGYWHKLGPSGCEGVLQALQHGMDAQCRVRRQQSQGAE